MAWLIEHRQLISLLVNVGMLVVWIVYLHVFSAGFRRQHKATILINVGQGQGLDAHCLVTNMSAEPVYIHTVLATLRWQGGEATCPVTEPGCEKWSHPSDVHLWTRQGPLASAQIRDMGAMQAIIDHVRMSDCAPGGPPGDARWQSLDIQVIAIYASEDLPVAASRSFDIVRDGGATDLRPRTYDAHQVRSRRQRRKIARALVGETRETRVRVEFPQHSREENALSPVSPSLPPETDDPLVQVPGRVRSLTDLHNFVASNQGKSTALDALSPVNRRTFIDSLTFNEKGITGFSYAPLEGLSASQAYAILSLFGVERLTPRLKGIRAYNQADKLILSPSNAAYPLLMKDYDGYYCAGRASCAPRFSWICTGNC